MLQNTANSRETQKVLPRQKDKKMNDNIKPDYINVRTVEAICNNNISNNKHGKNNAKISKTNK